MLPIPRCHPMLARECRPARIVGRNRLALAFVGVFIGGCERIPSGPVQATSHDHGAFAANLSPSEIAQSLKALRAHTAGWHNPDKAEAAGYTLPVGCTDERTEGLSAFQARGMGFHTLNPALIDGETRLLDPDSSCTRWSLRAGR